MVSDIQWLKRLSFARESAERNAKNLQSLGGSKTVWSSISCLRPKNVSYN